MTEKEQSIRDLQEFRELWAKLSLESQRRCNSELLNLMSNCHKHSAMQIKEDTQ